MRYMKHHNKTNNCYKKLKKYLPGGAHYNFNFPWEGDYMQFVRSDGTRLWDMDGNEYLDFYAKFGAMILGHNNVEYNNSLKYSIEEIMIADHSPKELTVCELLTKYIPCAEMVRFGLSGTEMVQNAIRLARAYTGKNKFIRFEGHYHGSADNIMGGKVSNYTMPYPIEYSGDYRGTSGRAKDIMQSQSLLLPWNDIEFLQRIVSKYGDDIAAIITEPICINGGGIMPKQDYLEKMRKICDRNNIVLIFDEIITGFRVNLGGAQKIFNVVPDLAIFGKALGGGAIPV